MCGLVGGFRPTGGAVMSSEVLAAMRDRMVHRGPDGAGLWRAEDGTCALAHRRLSIIDLTEAGAQPMANAAGDVVLVYNGEIYNFMEVRRELEATRRYAWRSHSDTEVLLHAFEAWGPDCVKRFHGDFAVAIVDRRRPGEPVLHLIRDRAGVKPLYFARTAKGEWLFASEIRALMAHPDMTPEMDRTAFWHYLTFIVAPAPLTLFRGVFKLPAGYRMTVDHRGRAVAEQYWDCRPAAGALLKESDLSFDEAVEEVRKALRRSIERRMVSDVPFGVLLSGGVDSSLNVALMSELMDRPVTTFTVGYDAHEEFNEFHHARRVAERYGTDHHETRISSGEALEFLPRLVELQDEPIADNVCIPLYFLARLVRQSGTTVVQVGEGADENFLGYWWCEHYRQKAEQVYEPARRSSRRSLWQRLTGRLPPALAFQSEEDEAIRRRAEAGRELFWGGAVCWWGDLRNRLTPSTGPFEAPVDLPVEGLAPQGWRTLDSHAVVGDYLGGLDGRLASPEVLQKISYMEMKLRIPEHLLMRVDKMTMAHSVEARVPFLDHDVIELARTLPPSYKLSDGIGKRILKKMAEPYVDHDLLYRRKQGFGAPMDKWFSEESFGRRCLAAFDNSEIRKQGYFDNGYLRDLLQAQVDGRLNYGFHLWTIMNVVFWHERWIAQRDLAA